MAHVCAQQNNACICRLTLTAGDKLRAEYEDQDFLGIDLDVEHLCAERGRGHKREFLVKFKVSGELLEPRSLTVDIGRFEEVEGHQKIVVMTG